MSEQINGKRLPGKYWRDQNKLMAQEKITPKELIQQSGDYLRSRGYVYNPILGWVKEEDLKEVKMDENQNSVPIRIEATKKGKVKRINYLFSQYMNNKKRDDWRRNVEKKDIDSMVDFVADSMNIPF